MKTNMTAERDDFVVLLKSVSETGNRDDDSYCKSLQSANFQKTEIEDLKIPGIIFTSPRCVKGIELSLCKEGKEVLEKWKKHKHFVVGEKTAQMVENLGFATNGKEAGNVKNLIPVISVGKYRKPFLYPKGSLTTDTLSSSLKENHIKVDEVLIYKTKPHIELETHIENLKSCLPRKTVYFVYFSPSGVNFSLPIFQKYSFDLNLIKFIAIGPTTESALQENGLDVAACCLKPEPKALVNALSSLSQETKMK